MYHDKVEEFRMIILLGKTIACYSYIRLIVNIYSLEQNK